MQLWQSGGARKKARTFSADGLRRTCLHCCTATKTLHHPKCYTVLNPKPEPQTAPLGLCVHAPLQTLQQLFHLSGEDRCSTSEDELLWHIMQYQPPSRLIGLKVFMA